MRYDIGGLSLNVEKRGEGALSLIFLHYWGGTSRTWNKVTAELDNSFQCISYDSRGWGASDAPSDGYSIASLADDAAALIKTLGVRRYVLVGHSMGGKVAQLLASRQPSGLAGLVLVAPASPSPVLFPEEARNQQIHAYSSREAVVQTIGFLSARTPAPEIVEQIVKDSMGGSAEAKLAWPTEAILEDISAEISKITVPTLVLAGDQDRLDSIEQHREEIVKRVPNARLEVISGSGHLIPIDQPQKLAAAIADFAEPLAVAAALSSLVCGSREGYF